MLVTERLVSSKKNQKKEGKTIMIHKKHNIFSKNACMLAIKEKEIFDSSVKNDDDRRKRLSKFHGVVRIKVVIM